MINKMNNVLRVKLRAGRKEVLNYLTDLDLSAGLSIAKTKKLNCIDTIIIEEVKKD